MVKKYIDYKATEFSENLKYSSNLTSVLLLVPLASLRPVKGKK